MDTSHAMLSLGHAGFTDAFQFGSIARNDATIATALSTLGATATVLLVPCSGDGLWTWNSAHTFPETLLVVFGAGVTVQGSGALTFGRPPVALAPTAWYRGTGVVTLQERFAGAVSLGDPRWGAVGDGVTDDSAAVQRACLAAVARGVALDVPVPAVGYRLNTPIDLTDLDGPLTIRGQGICAPTFGLAYRSPTHTSVFLGNTGLGHCCFDCLGSNNLLFRDLNFSTLGMPTPSTYGIVFGTSTTSPALQAPGGGNCALENVAIYMQNASASCPVYFVGGTGVSHWINVWTLGVRGFVLATSNVLSFASTYATIGAAAGVDGMTIDGCALLGYGDQPVLWIQNSHNMRFSQLYLVTILGGPTYTGVPYPILIDNAADIKIEVESDYWPSLFRTLGSIDKLSLEGTVFPSTTPIPATAPLVGFFDGTQVVHSRFAVTAPHTGAVANYWYTSVSTTPTLQSLRSCHFLFDSAQSSNILFGHTTGAVGIPFFNLVFDGTTDTATFFLAVNGVPATNGQKRYRVNGVLFGTG
jgi:hypothetical protein